MRKHRKTRLSPGSLLSHVRFDTRMKRFHFSLDAALRLRQVQFRAAEVKLTDLLTGEQRLRKALATVLTERTDAAAYVQQHSGDILGLRTLPSYYLGLSMRQANLRQSLETLLATIAKQRDLVASLERSCKLLSKLREKKFSEWRVEAARELERIAQECWQATHDHAKKLEQT